MAQTKPATVRVTGYREVVRGLKDVDRATRKAVRDDLRHVGDHVETDAAVRFAGYSPRSAAGYRTYVRQRGVSVEQSLRKTTGLRPDFGKLQMRKALLPALAENEDDTKRAIEESLDRICGEFNAL